MHNPQSDTAHDFIDFEVCSINPEMQALTRVVIARNRPRATQALHIGTTRILRVRRFLTADPKQALTAPAAGLKTELIEA